MPSLDRMPADSRRALVRTAAAEFAEAGYERASLNRIIRGCGISKSSFYNRLGSKRELFDLVVTDLGGDLAAAVGAPAPAEFAAGDYWGGVEALLTRFATAAGADPAYTALGRLFYLADSPAGRDDAVPAAFDAVSGWVRAVLVVGRERGDVRADLPVALQHRLVTAVLRALDEWAVTGPGDAAWPGAPADDPDAGTLVAAPLDLLRRMLAPDPPPGPPPAP